MAEFVSPCKTLYRQGALRCDQDASFLGRKIGAQQFVEGLKHQRGPELSHRPEHVDSSTTRSFDLLPDAEITVGGMRGLCTGENRLSAIDHQTLPWHAPAILGNP